MTKFEPYFKKEDNENFLMRTTFENFFNELNRYAKDPLNVENPLSYQDILPYYPVNWDFDQTYLIMYSLLIRHKKTNRSMLFTVSENEVVDWFLLIPEMTKQDDPNGFLEYKITMTAEDIPKSELAEELIAEINGLIENFDPNFDLKKRLVEFSEKTHLDMDFFFFVPYDFIELLKGLKLPKFHEDLVAFFENTIAWFEHYRNTNVYFDPLGTSFRLSPTFFGFHIFKNLMDTARAVPSKELMKFFIDIIERQEFNILILDNNVPCFCIHLTIDNGKLKVKPVHLSEYSNVDWSRVKDWNEIFDIFKKRTNNDTILMSFEDVYNVVTGYESNKMTMLEGCLELFTKIYSAPCANRYIFPRFVNMFGFELDEGMKTLDLKFKSLLKELKSALIVLINEENKGSEIYLIAELFSTDDGHIHFDVIKLPEKNIGDYSGIESLKQIKTYSENLTKRKYNVTFGIKTNEIKDAFSVEKMEEILGVQNFYHKLPALTSIFALILSMKTYDNRKIQQSNQIISEIERPPEIEISKIVDELKQYLANGIFILTEPGYTLTTIRSKGAETSGPLELDMEKIMKKK